MKILDLLKAGDISSRITVYDAWLVWDGDEWVVYSKPYRSRKVMVWYRGNDEEKAVEALLKASK